MDRAFEMRRRAEAQGDQGFGAVVVHDGKIVGQAPSAVMTRGDPTAHAEIEAIRDAARRRGQRNLSGCTLYSSFRPCAMCEAAAYWAGIDRMIHGTGLSDAGAPRLGRC
ncbi:MAG TPA: nucleoside deaminase [Vineibacter sp.]|nr:nucleoside deaminase [Vineibacter sp.]